MTSNNGHVAGLALAAPLASHDSPREIDRPRAERAARELLLALGADVESSGLRDTPRRMADAYAELLTPQPFRATTFPNDDGYDELIVARAIPFHSLCMHHLLPFHGVAHIGYLPGERIIGLSKLGRVVELFARDLQIQERLTTQIAGWLQRELEPNGVGVVLEAEHMCMSLRGVQKFGARTVTSALHGLIRDDARTRQEFLALTTRTAARPRGPRTESGRRPDMNPVQQPRHAILVIANRTCPCPTLVDEVARRAIDAPAGCWSSRRRSTRVCATGSPTSTAPSPGHAIASSSRSLSCASAASAPAARSETRTRCWRSPTHWPAFRRRRS